MKALSIPGYKDLFGNHELNYDEFLRQTSSDSLMMLLISLNLELNSKETFLENQERLLKAITYTFSFEQITSLENALAIYKKKVERKSQRNFKGEIFGRRYLLSMILKELKRNNKVGIDRDFAMQEYDFFLSYLLTVDEVNKSDYELLDIAKKYSLKYMPAMPLLWASNIRQFEFNDWPNASFEIFKLLSFCKFAYDNYKPHLKELINKYGFVSIGQFIGSFHEVIKATMAYHPNEPLKKLYFITPNEKDNLIHLDSLCINLNVFEEFGIDDLRKYPLYRTEKRAYMVIDENMYMKKVYRGPLFDLHKKTNLNEKIKFEDYKTIISKDCFENILFKGIISQIANKGYSVFRFDSNSDDGEPDLYSRLENDVFLIEFKDYLFPESILKAKNFGNYRKYIDERFFNSSEKKKKGVSQLANCIDNLLSRKYTFDLGANEKLNKGEYLNIYPIICHTDFMFSMPGLNEYLNCLFEETLRLKRNTYPGIHKVTLINLEILFDLSLREKSFTDLLDFLKRYYKFIDGMRREYVSISSSDNFVSSTTSFDEYYQTKFRNEMIDKGDLSNADNTRTMREIIAISQEEIDEFL